MICGVLFQCAAQRVHVNHCFNHIGVLTRRDEANDNDCVITVEVSKRFLESDNHWLRIVSVLDDDS